jgi:hypothetical protein
MLMFIRKKSDFCDRRGEVTQPVVFSAILEHAIFPVVCNTDCPLSLLLSCVVSPSGGEKIMSGSVTTLKF